MSSSGVQNYLSNVFRQVYTYDTLTTLYTPKLELSNIDTYSGNSAAVATISVGDANSNAYVGNQAGNAYSDLKNCSNVSAFGVLAGNNISYVRNSVFLGYNAGAQLLGTNDSAITHIIAIGANSGGGRSSNILIGSGSTTTGSSNVFIGHGVSSSNISNQVRVGMNTRIPIAADLSTNWVGLGGVLAPVYGNEKVDISGIVCIMGGSGQGALGINTQPNVNGTLDVNGNFNVNDGHAYTRMRTDDTSLLTTVTMSNYDPSGSMLLNVSGVTRSAQGFQSLQGTVDFTTLTLLTPDVPPGITIVSVVDTSITSNYAAATFFTPSQFLADTLNSSSNGYTSLSIVSNTLRLNDSRNTPVTYKYSVSFFPLP